MEVTGQSGLETEALGAHDAQPSHEVTPEGGEASPTPAEETQSGTLPLPVGLLSEPENAASPSWSSGPVGRILYLVFILAALLAFLPLRRKLLLLLRSRRFEQSDTRRAVIAMHKCAQKAAAYGSETPELLVATAERAAFSQHEILSDEVERCRDQLFIALKSCYLKQKPWNRFRFKYLSALL